MFRRKWTDWHTAALTFALVTGYFIISRLLRGRGILPPGPSSGAGLGETADLVEVLVLVVTLLAPWAWQLGRRLADSLRSTPGNGSFEEKKIDDLKQAFELEMGTISLAMVPSHIAKAKAATHLRNLDFGDAALVIPKSALRQLQAFISRPSRHPPGASDQPENNILVITGEPGAGKSVLIQEVHAAISRGVIEGFHRLVPVFIFARDLLLSGIRDAAASGGSPIRALLLADYRRRYEEDPADSNLASLYNLVKYEWDQLDWVIFIDGLDEIPQKSAYEEIQRGLASLISADLSQSKSRVHRYILSCRVDEDLELFHGAHTLYIRGLSDSQREQFCRSMLGAGELDREARAILTETIRSGRLIPEHVFLRNPYFLSLLVRHIREDQDRARSGAVDFDFLMRKYLEREAGRPHASVVDQGFRKQEERRILFGELEKVSRPCLQFLAFRSASEARRGALYDEIRINQDLINAFILETEGPSRSESSWDPWDSLRRLLDECVRPARSQGLGGELIHQQGFLDHFHENDVRIFDAAGAKLATGHKLIRALLDDILGTIRFRGGIESPLWYDHLLASFLPLFGGLERPARESLAALLFVRSIAAAHVLRILNVRIVENHLLVRFRHRRLAEYYAASYCTVRWPEIENSLEFSPWLAPALNLACAIEGAGCTTLQWLIRKIPHQPQEPLYKWRYAIEAAVEAVFFAHPGPAYTQLVRELAHRIISALSSQPEVTTNSEGGDVGSRGSAQGDRHLTSKRNQLDAISLTVLNRSIEQLGMLKKTFRGAQILDEELVHRFYAYQASASPEWMPVVLPARAAIQNLVDRAHPVQNTLTTLAKSIQQPGSILFANYRSSWRGLLIMLVFVRAATACGEIILICGAALATSAALFGVGRLIGADQQTTWDAARALFLILFVSVALLRGFKWLQSPTDAASMSAAVWRLPSWLSGLGKRIGNIRMLRLVTSQRLTLVGVCTLFLGLAGIILYLGSSDLKSEPCPAVNKKRNSVWAMFTSEIRKVDPAHLSQLQGKLREELDELARINRADRCGRDIDGRWVLAEDSLADELFEFDHRLVPLPSPGQTTTLTTAELGDLQRLLSGPLPESTNPGLFGGLAALTRSRSLASDLETLRDLRAKVLDARRKGIGIPSLDLGKGEPIMRRGPEAAAQANALLQSIDSTLEKGFALQKRFEKSARGALITLVVWALAIGLCFVIGGAYWRRRAEGRLLTELRDVMDPHVLCQHLLDSSHSERVRRFALRRLDFSNVNDDQDLRVVEDTASSLLSRSPNVDRNLGVAVASVGRALANRLRHRTTVDAPLMLTAKKLSPT